MSRAAAVVLAAGAGRRLGGRAKATLRVPDGRTFLAAVVDCARAAGCEEVVVVVGPPHDAETAAAADGLDVVVVKNPDPARGMVSSLAAGLVVVRTGAVDIALAWPVDHPSVAPATVRAVLDAATRQRIVVPFHAGRGGHPTAFGRDHWPALLELPVGGARAVAAGRPHLVDRIPVEDPGVLIDVDTPGDYDKIK